MANLTKDQRLIKNNPNKTPYELKELGLSDKGFDELMGGKEEDASEETEETPAPVQKTVPQITVNTNAQPKLKDYVQPNQSKGMAFLYNKKTGKRTRMTEASASRQARKYPAEYQVLPI